MRGPAATPTRAAPVAHGGACGCGDAVDAPPRLTSVSDRRPGLKQGGVDLSNTFRTDEEHAMKGYVADIEEITEGNDDFRRVLYTGANLQLVLMSLLPGEAIGEEVHATHDQFFRIEKGKGIVSIDGAETRIKKDVAVIVPAGARHNIVNTGEKPMRLYTLYAPPQHRDGFVARTRAVADAAEERFEGAASE
jgi:mannose-6-phosphate isomerase-like protein (cupin superfamily)